VIQPGQGTVGATQVDGNFSLWNKSGSNINYTAGNVGIGTASPSVRLQVSGEAVFGGAGTYQTVSVNNNSATGGGAFAVQQNGSTRGGINVSGAWLGDTSSDMSVYAVAPNIRFYTNNSSSERMRIDSSGNVGIGTTSPDIFGRFYTRSVGINSSGTTALQINGTSYGTIDLGAGGTRNTSITGSSTEAQIATVTAIPILFTTNAVERLRIASNGALGLSGTNYGTSGQALLSQGSGSAPVWGDVSSIGVGQSWTNVGGSRSSGTTYTNSTGRAIQLMVATDNTGNSQYGSGNSAKFFINGSNVGEAFCSNAANVGGLFQAIIPPSSTYQVSASIIRSWWELR
jgi:hypothetical protein